MNLNFSDKMPLYFQIADLIRHAILSGDLTEGEPIPSVRKMAVDYNINHQTILKATQILIQEELLEKKRGQGMFVRLGALGKLQKNESQSFLEKEFPNFIRKAKALNMSKSEIIHIIKKQFEDTNE
ncbi:MAG: GntR family transcriptional regulator [Candidatus Marinimicrobia bacterium]|jgi:GntR family transcriptional regulator|nr:GntR family transcriptional regulator [Candidatus Neomarinimicrobiota bacterium]MBT3496833.1 GntR family transcriptional regulator [Candidatus Neomarinimicrobiota bacterium]MBT3692786.1 GntR family transcriptional regulator [Candidatus Neomarinimicrobiota bacterium]MBT3732509.1 GntR family transcriptional regulator [Candidatus Neomarinimicrobiota bacterium]MBT4143854.1 GntR family transcriptional regulator [Candidatus Neomarinimicrobiota bacterium]